MISPSQTNGAWGWGWGRASWMLSLLSARCRSSLTHTIPQVPPEKLSPCILSCLVRKMGDLECGQVRVEGFWQLCPHAELALPSSSVAWGSGQLRKYGSRKPRFTPALLPFSQYDFFPLPPSSHLCSGYVCVCVQGSESRI